jgi:hypothetical protein
MQVIFPDQIRELNPLPPVIGRLPARTLLRPAFTQSQTLTNLNGAKFTLWVDDESFCREPVHPPSLYITDYRVRRLASAIGPGHGCQLHADLAIGYAAVDRVRRT